MSKPYGGYALRYRAAGWLGVLPLPPGEKAAPPRNFTGDLAPDPDDEQIATWVRDKASGNIALRLPKGIIALDLDLYHEGAREAWDERVSVLGPLPPTWVSTSRTDGSGKLLFSAPDGHLRGAFPWGEVLRHGHRYVMAAPSSNGHDGGRPVRWISPDGEIVDDPPPASGFPELPAAWLEYLSTPAPPPPEEILGPLCAALPGEWATPVQEAVAVYGVTDGSRHDAMVSAVLKLANYEHAEYPGATEALEQIASGYPMKVADTRGPRMAGHEVKRAVVSARQKAATSSTLSTWDPGPPLSLMPPAAALVPQGKGAAEVSPSFPIEIIPVAHRPLCVGLAENLASSPGVVGEVMMTTAATAVGNGMRLRASSTHVVKPIIWLVVVANSGDSKSPVFHAVLSGLDGIRAELEARHQFEMAAYAAMDAKDKKTTVAPRAPRVVLQKFTMQSLRYVLPASPGGVIGFVDEILGLVRGFDEFTAGSIKGSDRQQMLPLRDGKRLEVDLVDGSFSIPDVFLNLVGGLQYSRLAEFVRGGDDGLPYRMTFVRHPGGVVNVFAPDVPDEWLENWKSYCTWLRHLPRGEIQFRDQSKPSVYRALSYLQEKYNEIPTLPEHFRSYWKKIRGKLFEKILLLSVMWGEDEVSIETVERAILWMEFELSEYRILFMDLTEDVYRAAQPSDEERLLSWLATRGGVAPWRDVVRGGPWQRVEPGSRDRLLNSLLADGVLKRDKMVMNGTTRRVAVICLTDQAVLPQNVATDDDVV